MVPKTSQASRYFVQPYTGKHLAPQFVPGEILVRFRGKSPQGHVSLFATDRGKSISIQIESLSSDPLVDGLVVARVAPEDTLSAIVALHKREDVVYAEPNFIRRKLTLPNDNRFNEQWALKNSGQSGGTIGADIDAELAWNTTTGSRDIVVGVIDEGIDINHPDLKDNIWTNPGEIPNNGVDDDGNGFADDVNGWDFFNNDRTVFDGNGTFPADDTDAHGTHVAGIIGAQGNNGIGITGVNWQVRLMSLKFLGPAGGTTADLLRALSYANAIRTKWIASGGAQGANLKVLNNSYGGNDRSQAELDAINVLSQSGILFVAAAGNEKLNNDRFPHFPAAYDAANLVAVAATDRFDDVDYYSNTGPRTVHLAAPGTSILSTTPNGTYTVASGTSAACPHVTGTATILLASNPNISLNRLRAALLFGGDRLGALANEYYILVQSGRRLNAAGALASASENDSISPATAGSFQKTGQVERTVNLSWIAPGDDGTTGQASIYELRYSDQDLSNVTEFEKAYKFVAPIPSASGNLQITTINIPVRHTSGFIGIRAIDNTGNFGPIASIPVTVPIETGDPFIVTTSAAEPLSTGGTSLNLVGDDVYSFGYQVPPSFRFLGTRYGVVASTNGALYFASPPLRGTNGEAGDFESSADWLNGMLMVAGIWDDLRTDRRPGDGVYVVQPDPSRVIFRWQAVTFDTPLAPGVTRGEHPVNFEIELRQDSSVIIRYGEGNTNLLPVVGLSLGDRDSYLIESHTSTGALRSLTNAATLTFTPRSPTPTPSADLTISINAAPDPVFSSRQLTYSIEARNSSFETFGEGIKVIDHLPAGTSFVSCTGGFGPCSEINGVVTADLGLLSPVGSVVITIVVQVTAPPGSVLQNNALLTGFYPDPNNANNSSTVITDVVQVSNFLARSLSAGGESNTSFSVALKTDGTVWAWGNNSLGQLGDGQSSQIEPFNSLPVPVSGLTGIEAITAGTAHALALKSDGTVWAWGANHEGQLGIGTFGTISSVPVQVHNLTGVVAVAASNSSLALRTDGTVWQWGTRDSVGNPLRSPAQVENLSDIVSIALGSSHSLAVKRDGTVWAWGSNTSGQSGQPTTNTFITSPMQVPGLSDFVAIAGGQSHTLALRRDGTVWAWGSNFFRELGTNTGGGPIPVLVNSISGVTAIDGGLAYSLVLKNDGTVWGWGRNLDGQLGVPPSSSFQINTPTQINGIVGAQSITGASSHSGVVLADGTLRMWGRNGRGELGDASTIDHFSPVIVSGLLQVGVPSFSPEPTTSSSVLYVAITSNTPGAIIRYTTNSQEPTRSDPIIPSGGLVRIDHHLNLKAKAWKTGMAPSLVRAGFYTIFLNPNPIDEARTLVRQHYSDFLDRAADQGGEDYWTGQLTACGTDVLCMHERRIGVSAAFFAELEFQRTGYVVYRAHRAAFGLWPGTTTRANLTFAQFTADRPLLPEGSDIAQSTVNFANTFVQRPGFLLKYPAGMSNNDFVNLLFDTSDLRPYTIERQQQVGLMDNGKTRAQVLLDVIEIPEFKTREFNRSFVLMEYFGYLRRDPEQGGYDFWLEILNNHVPNNYRSMVCSFLTSAEYQRRFGTSVTRTNNDCGPWYP